MSKFLCNVLKFSGVGNAPTAPRPPVVRLIGRQSLPSDMWWTVYTLI